MQFKLIIVFLSALFVAVFALQNSGPIMINLLVWHFETRTALVILGSAVLGALCIGVLSFFKQIGVGMRNLDYQTKIRKLEGEIEHLKGEIGSYEAAVGSLEEEKLDLLKENQNLKNPCPNSESDQKNDETKDSF